jgi:hypothetical protein
LATEGVISPTRPYHESLVATTFVPNPEFDASAPKSASRPLVSAATAAAAVARRAGPFASAVAVRSEATATG